MAEVKFGQGYAWKMRRNGKRKTIDSLSDALSVLADCGICGCDPCLGYWTQINAETGDLMAMWITGTDSGSYTLNIDTYDNAMPTLRTLKDARE